MPRYEDRNSSYYLKLTHTLSRNVFYNLSANFYSTERKRGDGVHFDNLFGYGRPDGGGGIRYDDYTRLFRPWDDPTTPDIDESYTTTYLHRKSSYYGLRFDMTSQINSSNELKLGCEYLRHTLRYYTNLMPFQVYYQYDGDSNLIMNPSAWVEVNNYGYDITGAKELDDGWNGAKHPSEIALYLQDKFEWEGLIVNAGVRYDYFNTNTLRLINDLSPLDPYLRGADDDATPTEIEEAQKLTEVDLEGSKPEHQVSPRFGIAYPVSENTHFRVSYGKFFQRPELQYLYVSYDYMEYKAKEGAYYPIGNPNLEPEETSAYEVGVTHRLGENARLDVTAYYKDVKNLTVLERQENIDPNLPAMTWYRNRDFGTIKGIETNLKMRRTRNIALDLSYTLSWATGTGSDATSLDNITWMESERPLQVSPLDYDQRHKFTAVMDVRAGENEGPKLGDFHPFENAGVNVVFNVASGTRYTAAEIRNELTLEADWPRPVSTINSRSGPWTYRVDLKANRSFRLFDLGFDAYLWVLNLFDRKNVIDVYEGTGKPDETGFLSTQEGQDWVQGRQEENDLGYIGEQLYRLKESNPLNYDIPRLVRFGLRLSF
jgi:outer membrane receptor protein involved in Fe transport